MVIFFLSENLIVEVKNSYVFCIYHFTVAFYSHRDRASLNLFLFSSSSVNIPQMLDYIVLDLLMVSRTFSDVLLWNN